MVAKYLDKWWEQAKTFKNSLVYRIFADPMRKIIADEFSVTNVDKLGVMLRAIQSNYHQNRTKLLAARQSKEYDRAYKLKKPLVSVRIPTFNKGKILVERTLPSILNQTYQNIEVIVIGDNCTDDTEELVKKLNHPKVKFMNMPYRGRYPENKLHRWYVASTTPANEGLFMAKGAWIAPFDDDDEMTPNHIEDLLQKAQSERLEFVYGKALSIDQDTGEEKIIGVFPPAYGHVSFNASLLHGSLKFFEYDLYAWTVDEPGDWNLIRRMMECGVMMGFVDEIVTKINFIHPKRKTKGLHKTL